MNLLVLDVKVNISVKRSIAAYTRSRTKENSLDNKSEIFNHITSCEHFQHIKSIFELYPNDEANSTLKCVLPEFIYI